MAEDRVVERQMKSFEKVLRGIETDRYLTLNEKLTKLIAVQQTMFVFIFDMADPDFEQFKGVYDSVFSRLCAETESEKAA